MSPLTTLTTLTTSPVTLPSPQREEGVAVPSPFLGEGRVRVG
jgi:hypothetical protein